MACGICGSSGHNRRTHAEHEEPQPDALMGPQSHEFEDPTGQVTTRANGDPGDLQHPTFLVGRARVVEPVRDVVALPIGTSSEVGKEEDGSTSADADAGQVPILGAEPGWTVERATHELVGEHECEPAPDQVYYCRHCGADLMVYPEPVDNPGRPLTAEEEIAVYEAEKAVEALDPMDRWEGTETIRPPWRTKLEHLQPIRITVPGVYILDANEYHDPAITGDWLSNSDARQLTDDGCPAQFRYDRDHGVRKRSDAFAVGHAYHATVLGKGETIAVRPLVNPADPDQVWDSWRTNAAKAWRAEQEAAGRSVILPEDAAVVEAMAAAVHAKPRAHELLSQPGRPEVALFWVDPVTGVKRRCLVDYLPDGPGPDGVMRPVDLKSADEVAPTASMEKKLYDHCWHRQAVTIADGIRALGLADEVEFYFIVQSKKAPHLVTVVVLDADAERIGGIENLEAMRVYQQCIESGVWPDYAADTVTLTVPPWIARLYEDEIEVSH